jgi:hypothetical protein
MKNLLLIFCLLSFTFGLKAQDFGDEASTTDNTSDVVSVLDVSGKAKYKAPNSKRFKRVKPGAVLEKSGSVKLNKKGKLDLLYKGHPTKMDGKGTHDLDNLAVNDDAETDDFMAFLSTASGFAGPGGGPKKDTTDNPSGGHGKGQRILGTQPPGGKVVIKPTMFSWTDGGADKYMFKLYQGNSSQAVFSKEVTTNELKVNLADIEGLQSNTLYKWQIETTTEEGITRKSPAIDITLATVDESDKLLRNLRGMEAYKKSSSWEKRLREVHALRSNGFFIEAKAISRMITKQFPKNKIVEGAAALF